MVNAGVSAPGGGGAAAVTAGSLGGGGAAVSSGVGHEGSSSWQEQLDKMISQVWV
jgi:hypothetical protein